MKRSRSEYVALNVSIILIVQIIKNLLSFIGRTVYVYTLGAEYLGVNSLFTDILSVLSFAELGFGSALNFSLYKPLSECNIERIKTLMSFYKRAYRIIGCVIGGLGICIIPFIRYIVGDVSYIKEDLTLIYLLFLFNSVSSYFYVYKQSLIIADQKSYIVSIYQQVIHCINILLQIIFLLITRAYLPYLIIMIVSTFLTNIIVAKKADRLYPFLKDKDIKQIGTTELNEIKSNIKALFSYKVGAILIESTDSIFISIMANVVTVGIYANYKMIIYLLRGIIGQITNSAVASVGNLNASGNIERKEKVFNEIMYIGIWIFGFFTMGLIYFLTPFIELWLGNDYIIDSISVIAACLYFYITGAHLPCYMYRNTAGLFVYGKYVPLYAAFLNIVLDFFMGLKWGLPGILWASVLCKIFTYNLMDPIIIYKRIFNKIVGKYFAVYVWMTLLVFFDGVISYRLSGIIAIEGMIGLIIRILLFSILFNMIFFAITYKSDSFKSLRSRILILIKSKV